LSQCVYFAWLFSTTANNYNQYVRSNSPSIQICQIAYMILWCEICHFNRFKHNKKEECSFLVKSKYLDQNNDLWLKFIAIRPIALECIKTHSIIKIPKCKDTISMPRVGVYMTVPFITRTMKNNMHVDLMKYLWSFNQNSPFIKFFL